MITYIQLGSEGILDVKDDVTVPLNFSIAEIQDISKKQGNFSKSIQLVGNANNNNLLSNLFDVNIADASFNVNVRKPCQIVQNGVPIFDGYLQLLSVNKLSSADNVDEFVEYIAQVVADSGTFYASMQEDLLEDLPLWDQYNHIYTLSSVTATSAHTVNDGYTYFLPLKAASAYGITDFAPSIYAKAYWDRIFLVNNFTYDWSSIESVGFNDLIIPYNGAEPRADTANNFRAGFSSASTIEFTYSGTTNNDTDISEYIFDEDSTLPNYDEFNNYNPVTGIYTSNFIGTINFSIRYQIKMILNIPVDCILVGAGEFIGLEIYNIMFKNGDPSTPIDLSFSYRSIEANFSAGTQVIEVESDFFSIIYDTIPSDEFKTGFYSIFKNGGSWVASDGITPLAPDEIPYITFEIGPDSPNENNSFIGNPLNSLNEGQFVNVQSFIPKQIKQKDFISSIIKMYNLFIVPDKYEENHLIIKTRDEFYDDGPTVDWTDKLAIDLDSELVFLPDLQDKRLILSYKDDNDVWNRQYKEDTSETYGQVEYNFNTEFTQSTKRIETIFSPTPIVINTNGLLVPAILNKAPENNIRILQYNGWVEGQWQYGKNSPLNPSGATIFDTYPQALHLDDPINATLDINFAEPDYYYYQNYETVTNNNLYNKYWSRFINQIETGKMLTATFLLNEYDIANLDLSSKVWVHDNYYNINRIIDYNPNGNGLTKVELITVDEGLQFAPFSVNSFSTASTVNLQGIKHNWVTNWATVIDSQGKNNFGERVVNTPVLGIDNTIQGGSKSSLIIGNDNNYNGANGIVVGNDNNAQGNNLYVFGDGITITGDSQAIFNVPVSATTINVTELFINGSTTPIEAPIWEAGTGTDGVQQILGIGANDASGQSSLASGLNTTASGLATFATGEATAAVGESSIAAGNGSNSIGFHSMALGRFTRTNYDGEIATNGINTSFVAGEIQIGVVNSIESTTNATPTNLDFYVNGVAQNGFAPIPALIALFDYAMSFTYQMICQNSANGDARLITGEGLMKWVGGTPTLVFASAASINGDAGLAGIAVAPVANGLGLKFTVTGLAATNLEWTIRIDYNWNHV